MRSHKSAVDTARPYRCRRAGRPIFFWRRRRLRRPHQSHAQGICRSTKRAALNGDLVFCFRSPVGSRQLRDDFDSGCAALHMQSCQPQGPFGGARLRPSPLGQLVLRCRLGTRSGTRARSHTNDYFAVICSIIRAACSPDSRAPSTVLRYPWIAA